jgi:cytochrome c6
MKLILVCFSLAILIYACSHKAGHETANAAEMGAKVYKQYCVVCHGPDGKLGLNGAKDLTISKFSEAERIVQVTEGKGAMTPFKNVLSPEEIKAVVAYTLTLK